MIPIVLASDENYVPYMATAMQSVMENADKEQKYVFIILHKDLSEKTLEKLKQQVTEYSHFSIEFINVSEKFGNFIQNVEMGLCTVETYFRLAAPWILQNFEKIIYMDCDIVCNMDISEIYYIDIGDNLIAGVPDIQQISIHYNPKYKSKFRSSVIDKMNKAENYINAGFIVMNIKEFRDKFTLNYLLDFAQKEKFIFQDQDLLNLIAKDSVFIFPQNLNFLNSNWDISYAPKNLIDEYNEAKEKPKIIHYTTTKPWKQELNPLYFHLFWKYGTRTPFIDSIVNSMLENKLIGQKAKSFFISVFRRKIKEKIRGKS
jgi:lipopolysaccharide biosynthesis glycosyltransferase